MLLSVWSRGSLRDGVINYWALDGDPTDSIGGRDGEVIGGATWVAACDGVGVKLDGSSQHIHVPHYTSITETATYAAWINGWKGADWAGIVGSRTPTGVELIFGDNGRLHYVWNDNAADTWRWEGGPEIPMEE